MPRRETGSDDGARASVAALFDLHYVELVATARFLVDDRETAEDIVMEAFLASTQDPQEESMGIFSSIMDRIFHRKRAPSATGPRSATPTTHTGTCAPAS